MGGADTLEHSPVWISTNDISRIITGHVIYNPAYTYKFQMKTTNVSYLRLVINIFLQYKDQEALSENTLSETQYEK